METPAMKVSVTATIVATALSFRGMIQKKVGVRASVQRVVRHARIILLRVLLGARAARRPVMNSEKLASLYLSLSRGSKLASLPV